MLHRWHDFRSIGCLQEGLRSHWLAVLGTGLWCMAAAHSVAEDTDGLSAARAIERQFVDVISRCEGAVVSIAKVAPAAGGDRLGFNPLRRPRALDRPVDLTAQPQTFGSGVVIASDAKDGARYVLTNYHVLEPGAAAGSSTPREPLYVRLSNHRVVRGAVIAADPRSDLAVLRLDLSASGIDPADVTPIPLGDATGIRKGQMVLALGNPYAIARDGSASASWGMISNISRRAAGDGEEPPESEGGGTIHQFGTLLHVDMRLSLGTSGGALVNLDGELIGLTTSLAALEGYEKSVGFALPIDAAMRRVIDTLLQGFEVEYGFLGIQPGDVRPEELRVLGGPADQVSAARAMFVSAGSPAESGGLRSDDLILRINETPILSADDLMREIGLQGAGALTHIDVWRPSRQQRFQATVTLGKWPVGDDSRIVATRRRFPAWRGMEVDYPTARRRFLTSDVMEQYHHAVLVVNAAEESASFAAGLRPGDFITHVGTVAVETPAQFHNALAGQANAVTLIRLDGTQVAVPAITDE
ncbi:MAG: S1C family serine protease [Planctomycetaceae bacterium]